MELRDAAAVAELAGQLGYPSTESEVARRFRTVEHDPDSQVLVAEGLDGTVLAWLHVCATRHIESDPCAEIAGLVVAEGSRTRGIGRTLMGEAERWARERGLAGVALRSNVVRSEAHAFYQRLGYEIIKTQHKFLKRLDPEEAT
jgi:GNAT superfamily N-acetyltransferase